MSTNVPSTVTSTYSLPGSITVNHYVERYNYTTGTYRLKGVTVHFDDTEQAFSNNPPDLSVDLMYYSGSGLLTLMRNQTDHTGFARFHWQQWKKTHDIKLIRFKTDEWRILQPKMQIPGTFVITCETCEPSQANGVGSEASHSIQA